MGQWKKTWARCRQASILSYDTGRRRGGLVDVQEDWVFWAGIWQLAYLRFPRMKMRIWVSKDELSVSGWPLQLPPRLSFLSPDKFHVHRRRRMGRWGKQIGKGKNRCRIPRRFSDIMQDDEMVLLCAASDTVPVSTYWLPRARKSILGFRLRWRLRLFFCFSFLFCLKTAILSTPTMQNSELLKTTLSADEWYEG